MSAETEQSTSGWTVDTLKEMYDERLEDLDKRYEQRFKDQEAAVKAALASAEKAVLVAESNAEKWRTASNEWRGAMNDRERNLMPRSEAENSSKTNADKIDALATRIDKNEGRTSGLLTIFAILASLGVLVAIFMALRKG